MQYSGANRSLVGCVLGLLCTLLLGCANFFVIHLSRGVVMLVVKIKSFLVTGLIVLSAGVLYADDFYVVSAKDSKVQVVAAKRVEVAKSHREKMLGLRARYQQSTSQAEKKKILAKISEEKSAYMTKLRKNRAMCKKASKQKRSAASTAADKASRQPSSAVPVTTSSKQPSVAKQSSNSQAPAVKQSTSKNKAATTPKKKTTQVSTNDGATVTPCQAYAVMVEAAEFDDALLDYSDDEQVEASIEQPPLTIEGEEE